MMIDFRYVLVFGVFLMGYMLPEFLTVLGSNGARFGGYGANVVSAIGSACIAAYFVFGQ